ncbi:hypothetical protein CYMTET_4848 [Cymbomonas tetramitiformis]|uniref:Uncharacterized protein n=1 Tax=Cymbomonas tetramitiformis TaxID=36881 RepID=A0AAE0H0J4_9CHLO|nr:hypothetical protein CYMTET_4848 [Cymbomonas tetramitiformis]
MSEVTMVQHFMVVVVQHFMVVVVQHFMVVVKRFIVQRFTSIVQHFIIDRAAFCGKSKCSVSDTDYPLLLLYSSPPTLDKILLLSRRNAGFNGCTGSIPERYMMMKS